MYGHSHFDVSAEHTIAEIHWTHGHREVYRSPVKNQYFGDINDYRKYGLLRVLQRTTGLRLGVFWMLTPDDGRVDGKFVSYLNRAKQWRAYDPPLFDTIADALPRGRHVGHVYEQELLPGATFFDEIIPDDRSRRSSIMASGFHLLRESELMFFDPDNGIEIKSIKRGRSGSSKYLFWDEIAESFGSGKSLLVYQHFPREERNVFVARLFADLQQRTGCTSAFCFRTSTVAFFLLSQGSHAEKFSIANKQVGAKWAGQITPILAL
jgi:hypothetical protein